MKGWAVDTTARNPQRIKKILQLFKKSFNKKVWNEERQADFTRKMISAGLYRSYGRPKKKKILALRGRTWAAVFNRMGFARAYSGQKVCVTSVGDQLLRQINESPIFLRQMIKWQFPSPLEKKVRYVNLRPFVALVHLVQEVGKLSKDEIAIFVFTLTNSRNLGKAKRGVVRFRKKVASLSQSARRTYQGETMKRRLNGSRVTLDKAQRWLTNYRDYADTLMRYSVHTGLFRVDSGELFIPLANQEEAAWILQKYTSQAGDFGEGRSYLRAYYDPTQPRLPWEDTGWLINATKKVHQKAIDNLHELTARGIEIKKPRAFKPATTSEALHSQLKRAKKSLESLDSRLEAIRQVEEAGMRIAIKHERDARRRPRDVSDEYRGYDIYSTGRDEKRYIEVKAFARTGKLQLTAHEWLVAKRFGQNYLIYAIEHALSSTRKRVYEIRDPFRTLSSVAEEKTVTQTKIVITDWRAIIQ